MSYNIHLGESHSVIAGSLECLLSYETERQRSNVPIVTVIDTLQKLFSTSLFPVVLLRSLGLQLTGAVPSIKVRAGPENKSLPW